METQCHVVRLYCRNCGELGHGICKKQFTQEERIIIDAAVLEIKRSNKLVAQSNKRSGLQCSQCGQHGHSFCGQTNSLLQKESRKPMCSNCGQLGHGICKRQIADEERARIAEALRIRKEETKLAKQNNNRLRKAEKRKTLLKQTQEIDYRRSEHAKNLEKLRRQSKSERNFSSSDEDEGECKANDIAKVSDMHYATKMKNRESDEYSSSEEGSGESNQSECASLSENEQDEDECETSNMVGACDVYNTMKMKFRYSEEFKTKRTEYYASEEFKAIKIKYRCTDEYKAMRRKYRATPEYKAKKKPRPLRREVLR